MARDATCEVPEMLVPELGFGTEELSAAGLPPEHQERQFKYEPEYGNCSLQSDLALQTALTRLFGAAHRLRLVTTARTNVCQGARRGRNLRYERASAFNCRSPGSRRSASHHKQTSREGERSSANGFRLSGRGWRSAAISRVRWTSLQNRALGSAPALLTRRSVP